MKLMSLRSYRNYKVLLSYFSENVGASDGNTSSISSRSEFVVILLKPHVSPIKTSTQDAGTALLDRSAAGR